MNSNSRISIAIHLPPSGKGGQGGIEPDPSIAPDGTWVQAWCTGEDLTIRQGLMQTYKDYLGKKAA